MTQLTFTPAAARKLRGIIAERKEAVAVRIHIRRGKWSMTLEPAGPESVLVNGVPLMADPQTQTYLDGLVIDWVQTPQGEGFGVYDQNFQKLEMRMGAD